MYNDMLGPFFLRKSLFLLYGLHHAKNMSLGICGQQRPRLAGTSVQTDQSLHCLQTEDQWRANAQIRLYL